MPNNSLTQGSEFRSRISQVAGMFDKRANAAFGKLVFNKIRSNPSSLSGLYHSILPGFNQVRSLNDELRLFKRQVAGAAKTYGASKSPVDRAAVESMHRAHTGRMSELYAALGKTAEPRHTLYSKTIPGVTLAGGGIGAGAYGGNFVGNNQGQNARDAEMRKTISELPLLERLKYLVSPKNFTAHKNFSQPKAPAEIPDTEVMDANADAHLYNED